MEDSERLEKALKVAVPGLRFEPIAVRKDPWRVESAEMRGVYLYTQESREQAGGLLIDRDEVFLVKDDQGLHFELWRRVGVRAAKEPWLEQWSRQLVRVLVAPEVNLDLAVAAFERELQKRLYRLRQRSDKQRRYLEDLREV